MKRPLETTAAGRDKIAKFDGRPKGIMCVEICKETLVDRPIGIRRLAMALKLIGVAHLFVIEIIKRRHTYLTSTRFWNWKGIKLDLIPDPTPS